MSIYDRFETDKDLETSGVWIDYGADGAFLIAHTGGVSSEFIRAFRGLYKKNRARFDRDLMNENESQKLLLETFAKTSILNWRGIKDRAGVDIPFSKENAIKLISDLPNLGFMLFEEAKNYENFLVAEREEIAKNSETSSSGV